MVWMYQRNGKKACAKDGWGPDKNSNVQYTLIANMPAKNLDMYRKNAGSGKNIYYYVEGVNARSTVNICYL